MLVAGGPLWLLRRLWGNGGCWGGRKLRLICLQAGAVGLGHRLKRLVSRAEGLDPRPWSAGRACLPPTLGQQKTLVMVDLGST